MLPSPSKWKSWTPLERVSYLAQLATVLTLLVTAIFSFLSWREARLAREDQASYFLAEKAPNIKLKATSLLPGYVVFHLKNEGESVARKIRFDVNTFGQQGITGKLERPREFDEEDTMTVRDIGKGGEVQVRGVEIAAMEKVLGFTPTKYRLLADPESFTPQDGKLSALWITIYFDDVGSGHYSNAHIVEVSTE
jgi:hypothetical protein